MLVIATLIHAVGEEDAAPTVLFALIVKSVPLSLPTVCGAVEATTRILYAVPAEVPAGIVAEIVPAVCWVNEPILTGDVKLPEASDNWAVKIFPAAKVDEVAMV